MAIVILAKVTRRQMYMEDATLTQLINAIITVQVTNVSNVNQLIVSLMGNAKNILVHASLKVIIICAMNVLLEQLWTKTIAKEF
jgi:hypothetical protein